MEYRIFSPFGPRIGEFKLNDPIVDTMLSLTDEVLLDSNRLSHGDKLAGRIHSETTIDLQKLVESDLYDLFNDMLKHYIREHAGPHKVETDSIVTEIDEAWIVSQYENEYNPIHWHPNCSVSAVMYLKVPDFSKRKIAGKKNSIDGAITFINKCSPNRLLEEGVFTVMPEVGKLYMFPSYLLHTVYPFQGEGERRSVSFNGSYTPYVEVKS